jgi:DNA-binding Lrp family transcriptional regulator
MDEIDRELVNVLQDGLAVCRRPFDDIAARLGIDVSEVLGRIQKLLDSRMLSRFGPMYNAEQMGGCLSLCAMQVDAERFDAVAELVNAHPEVAHNYEREHALNMWFVVATELPEQHARVVGMIERECGCKVYDMPRQREYFIGLKLAL